LRHGGVAALGSAMGVGMLVVGAFFIGVASDAGVLWLVPVGFVLLLALIAAAGIGGMVRRGRRY
jgi:hypothetical protein